MEARKSSDDDNNSNELAGIGAVQYSTGTGRRLLLLLDGLLIVTRIDWFLS